MARDVSEHLVAVQSLLSPSQLLKPGVTAPKSKTNPTSSVAVAFARVVHFEMDKYMERY